MHFQSHKFPDYSDLHALILQGLYNREKLYKISQHVQCPWYHFDRTEISHLIYFYKTPLQCLCIFFTNIFHLQWHLPIIHGVFPVVSITTEYKVIFLWFKKQLHRHIYLECPLKTCSSPRCPLFLHALSFERTLKLCINFLNQFQFTFTFKQFTTKFSHRSMQCTKNISYIILWLFIKVTSSFVVIELLTFSKMQNSILLLKRARNIVAKEIFFQVERGH